MKVIELFAGVGAPRMALRELGIDHEVIGISEIDKDAIKAYNKIHDPTLNFGNIAEIKELPECDLLHFSSPCVSFSISGKQDGMAGQSGLLTEVFRLLENYKKRNCLPKYLSFENVKELKDRFYKIYLSMVEFLKGLGYNIYDECLKACYFDQPQVRERLFLIAIRNDIDDGTFKMPTNKERTKLRMIDCLEPFEEIDKKFIHPQERFTNRHYRVKPIPNDTFQTIEEGYYYTDKTKIRRQSNKIFNKNGLCPTLTTVHTANILEDNCIRRLTPREYWRIMGFKDEDFDKICKDISKSGLIKLAGNSICLGPMKAIYKALFIKEEENVRN